MWKVFGLIGRVVLGIWLMAMAASLMSAAQAGNGPRIVRIGYQKSGVFLLAKAQGDLERTLTPLGCRVEWQEFPAGPPLLEALNAGSIDIGHSGECPVILAQSSGVPLLYFGSSAASPESEAIVVPRNSKVQKLADLKGKKVAFAAGSSAHYFTARALESVGLGLADIHPVYLTPPNALAAFQSGTVDAWSIWDPFFAAAEIDAGARVLTSGRGVTAHREFYFGRKEFVEANPDIVKRILTTLNTTGIQSMKDPAGTATYLSDKLGIGLDVLSRAQARNTAYAARPMADEVIAEQQQVADFLFKQGIIQKPVKIADAIFHSGEKGSLGKETP